MKLDVVGTQEVAQILDVEIQRISRLRQGSKLPPEVAILKATPLWQRTDIERFAKDGTLPKSKPKTLPVVGLSEVADICGKDKSQIGRWRREGKFPEPALEKRKPGQPWKRGSGLAATPLWERSEIEAFASTRAERAVA